MRDFICQRLTAAAEEIFTEFEKTVVHYEEEIDRLLEITLSPRVQLHRIEVFLKKVILMSIKEPTRVMVAGLGPRQVVTLRARSTDERGVVFSSSASYQADGGGEIHLDRDPCIWGSYVGVEPMGLLRSLRPEALQKYFYKKKALHSHIVKFSVHEDREEGGILVGSTNERLLIRDGHMRDFICQRLSAAAEEIFTEFEKTVVHYEKEIDHLENHMRTHIGENPFLCPTCGKRFKTSSQFYSHQKVHFGGKPFVCTICGKGFPVKYHLKVHERTHSGEKPFVCTICGKGFSAKRSLDFHNRTHLSE
ncbi:unnamed protein product [Menidia menidia]|uniref:(Atlantic silverside) hypothetical protein n=1 Tax=Menidia menidia TaxID=238744 RepID=A0A8S4ANJ5_9TELE|nr:unnamed protein product [Menidia menidia]